MTVQELYDEMATLIMQGKGNIDICIRSDDYIYVADPIEKIVERNGIIVLEGKF